MRAAQVTWALGVGLAAARQVTAQADVDLAGARA